MTWSSQIPQWWVKCSHALQLWLMQKLHSQDLTVSYEWTDASGTVLDSTDMLDTTSLNAGDVVTCTVTADDGNMQGQDSASATLVASN